MNCPDGKWGIFSYFISQNLEAVHPDDINKYVLIQNNSRVYLCLGLEQDYLVLQHKALQFRAKKDFFKIIPTPKFIFFDSVSVLKKDKTIYKVEDIFWHYNKKMLFYTLSCESNRIYKRYFEDELQSEP